MHVKFNSSSEFKKITHAWAKNSRGIKTCRLRETIAATAGFTDLKSYLNFLDEENTITNSKFDEKIVINGLGDHSVSRVFEQCITVQVSRKIDDLSLIKSISPQLQIANAPPFQALVLISEILCCNLRDIKMLSVDEFSNDAEPLELQNLDWNELYQGTLTDKHGFAIEVISCGKSGDKYNIAFNLDVSLACTTYCDFDYDKVLIDMFKKCNLRLNDYQLFVWLSDYVNKFLTINANAFVEERNGFFFQQSVERKFNKLFFDEIVNNIPSSIFDTLTSFSKVNCCKINGLSHELSYVYHLINVIIMNAAKSSKVNFNCLFEFIVSIDQPSLNISESDHIIFSAEKDALLKR